MTHRPTEKRLEDRLTGDQKKISNLEFEFFALILGQQIANFLLIYFQVRRSDEILLLLTPRDVGEYVGERVWYDSPLFQVVFESLHGKSFASAGLAVGENGTVETGQDRVDEIPESLVV